MYSKKLNDAIARCQSATLRQMYANDPRDGDVQSDLNDRYELAVAWLEFYNGKDAPCWTIDQDTWSLYSDLYKDDHGFRPRGELTRAQVQDWITRRDTHIYNS